jgi:hypothetical protein
VVVLLVAVVLDVAASPPSPHDGKVAAAKIATTSTTATSSTTTTASTPVCSAASLDPDIERQPGLPSGVVAMRQALAKAAVACDYEALARLADRHGPGVRIGFGDPVGPATELRRAEEGGHGRPPLFYLRSLLDLPYTRIVVAEGDAAPLLYAWPSAFDPQGADPADVDAVVAAGLYTRTEIAQMIDRAGGYVGYRVLISANGDWQAFVTGD